MATQTNNKNEPFTVSLHIEREREMGEMNFSSAHFAALVGNQELSSLI